MFLKCKTMCYATLQKQARTSHSLPHSSVIPAHTHTLTFAFISQVCVWVCMKVLTCDSFICMLRGFSTPIIACTVLVWWRGAAGRRLIWWIHEPGVPRLHERYTPLGTDSTPKIIKQMSQIANTSAFITLTWMLFFPPLIKKKHFFLSLSAS